MSMSKHSLNQIYFYLTEGCNLACRHCWIAPKFQLGGQEYPSLDFELFKSIIDEARPLGLSGVKLTGGEPLLHPRIADILEFIRTSGLNLVMETNGILCTAEMAKRIRGCKNPFVSVSVDSPDASVHDWVRGVAGSFERSVDGIRNLVKEGLKPQIIMTMMRCNKDHVEDMVRLAESLGASSVKFNVVQPTARGEDMHRQNETLSISELVSLGKWVEDVLQEKTVLRLLFHHPAVFRALSHIFGDRPSGCGTCGIMGIIGVLQDGSYALCGIGESVPELVFGNAAKDRLEDVWRNTPILNELREGLPKRLEGICAECVMSSRCLGSCVAQNYYRSKSLWSGFWYCEEADKAGLFPETRKAPKVAV